MYILKNEIRLRDFKGDVQSILTIHKREDLLFLDDIKELTGNEPDPFDRILVERYLESLERKERRIK